MFVDDLTLFCHAFDNATCHIKDIFLCFVGDLINWSMLISVVSTLARIQRKISRAICVLLLTCINVHIILKIFGVSFL